MKWPKSEEKIEIGGLEKLGGPPDGVPPPSSQMSGCATAFYTFQSMNRNPIRRFNAAGNSELLKIIA